MAVKMKNRPVTIRDVAEKAGVSINTVSRALNNKPDIAAETRALVLAISRELEYRPNPLARSLLGKQTHTLGLVVTDCTDPYYASLIRAIGDVASRRGYALLLVSSDETVAKEVEALTLLRDRRVDAFLLTAVDVEAPHVRGLVELGQPAVFVSRRPCASASPFVGNDNIAGERLAMRHLVELDHRRIATVSRTGTASTARQQLESWRETAGEAGLPHGPDLICTVPPSLEGGAEAARWLMGLTPRPTAVVAYNDLQAIGLMRAAREHGLAVPDELSVVGHDDIMLASLVEPGLTTVAQQISEIGRLAAEMAIALVEGKSIEQPSVLLAPKLVVRASTAAPAR